MKLIATLLLLTSTSLAQTTTATKPATKPAAKPASSTSARPAAHSAAAEHPCSRMPPLSPKIPALPAGAPCAKPLYTMTIVPDARLVYISPLEPASLAETLGLKPVTFSLDYVDTKVGAGELVAPHKWCTLNYTGYLVDGTKFDSSFDHPDPFIIPYGQHQVILGWDTGLNGMRVGGKRRLFIPYQLAYGTSNFPPAPRPTVIPAKSELIFDVELVSMSDQAPAPKSPTPAPAANPAAPATPPGASSTPAAPRQPATPPAPATPSAPATPTPPKPQ